MTAAEMLYMKANAIIFSAGKAHSTKMTTTPAKPTAFFTSSEAPMTVSEASENRRPTTGTKLPAIYLAVRIVTPSATAPVAPCTEMTPRNTVMNKPKQPRLTVRSKFASCVTLYLSDNELTMCSTAEKNSSGNTRK